MTHRDRVREALSHRMPDRIPLDFSGTDETKQKLKKYLGVKNDETLLRELGTDIREVSPKYAGPQFENYEGKEWEGKEKDKPFEDIWRIRRKPVSYGSGHYNEIYYHPLAGAETVADLDEFSWPRLEWWDMSEISSEIDRINEIEEYAIIVRNGNIFETAWYMRGLNNMLIDLKVRPEFATELMRRITDYKISYLSAILEAGKGKIDLVFTADDIGTQTGLLMSLDLWRRMIKPHHSRMNKILKEHFDVKILYHTDGAVMEAIPDLIDMGIDILNPLQFSARGMDPHKLKEDYGSKLCFHGGIDVQTILPYSTPDEVKKIVNERIKVLGKDGGYILGPSHAIQVDTPVENVLALYKTAKCWVA